MKQFTCTEEVLKVTNIETDALVVMHEGDSTSALPDEMVDDMCAMGWGTCDGVDTGERKTGAINLTAENTKVLHGKPAVASKPVA